MPAPTGPPATWDRTQNGPRTGAAQFSELKSAPAASESLGHRLRVEPSYLLGSPGTSSHFATVGIVTSAGTE